MKIIKQGDNWSKRVSCKGCKAVLQVEESDIQYNVSGSEALMQNDVEDIQGTFFVECPMCGQVCKLKDLPTPVGNRIKERK